jgi:hypothetical protein
MTRRNKLFLVWSVVNGVLLISALVFYDAGPNRDVDVVLYVLMGVLSIPTSVVVVIIAAGFLAGLNALTGAVLNVGRGEIVFIWVVFLVAGTVQWFAMVPWLRGRLARSPRPIGDRGL